MAYKISMDFGGTLIKIATFEEKRGFCFCTFPIKETDIALNYINQYNYDKIICTGGGSVKYRNLIQSELRCSVDEIDEFTCILDGITFLVNNSKLYSYQFDTGKGLEKIGVPNEEFIFPCTVVNIGTGTSILRAESQDSYTRIGGTPLSGGTFISLARIINPELSFIEFVKLSAKGNARNVDLTVENIYGDGIPSDFPLPSDTLASTLGKLDQHKKTTSNESDICASLLEMICYNTCQLAVLSSERGLDRCNNFLFTGSFVGNYEHIQKLIASWMNKLDKETKCYFVEYSEFVGCIGALVRKSNGTFISPASPSQYLFRRKVI